MTAGLPELMRLKYEQIKVEIKDKLKEFAEVPQEKCFYELCYCVCTPQSKAKSAFIVQQELESLDFLHNDIDPTPILRNPRNYIRFHNGKAKRLMDIKRIFPRVQEVLLSGLSAFDTRQWFVGNIKGFGMKESSHFLRNIGFRGLAILDRHILKHLVYCGLYDELPKIGTRKRYLEVEQNFINFADHINVNIDELDLLFWSSETGEIFK